MLEVYLCTVLVGILQQGLHQPASVQAVGSARSSHAGQYVSRQRAAPVAIYNTSGGREQSCCAVQVRLHPLRLPGLQPLQGSAVCAAVLLELAQLGDFVVRARHYQLAQLLVGDASLSAVRIQALPALSAQAGLEAARLVVQACSSCVSEACLFECTCVGSLGRRAPLWMISLLRPDVCCPMLSSAS